MTTKRGGCGIQRGPQREEEEAGGGRVRRRRWWQLRWWAVLVAMAKHRPQTRSYQHS